LGTCALRGLGERVDRFFRPGGRLDEIGAGETLEVHATQGLAHLAEPVAGRNVDFVTLEQTVNKFGFRVRLLL